MSDFDSNPFADPNAANPFSDPSVQQATSSNQRTGGVDEFNPFADGQQTKPGGGGGMPPPQPAVMQPTVEQPPPYSQSAAQQAATDDLQRRQEELERKAAELQRKEQELQRTMQAGDRKNNFPPLPDRCCVQPCFYQDFAVDIPLEFQRIVKTLYYLWLAYLGLLALNTIGSLAYFIATVQSSTISNESGMTFGFSLLCLFAFTPCSFVCWYRPIYKAFRSDSSFNFFVFFFIFFFQVCVTVLQCLGIDGWGTCGWINGLGMITLGSGGALAVGIIMIIIGALFTGLAVADVLMLIRVHRIYRNTGASFEKAQAEFAQGVMSNRTVQQTAGNVAASTARSAMEGGANRY